MIKVYFDKGNDERCCICRCLTEYWTKSNIAVCYKCAMLAEEKDVLSKEDWVRREQIAEGDEPMNLDSSIL